MRKLAIALIPLLVLALVIGAVGCGGGGGSVLPLDIVSVTSPVSPGAYATLEASTLPDALCDITVYYKSGPSSAQGLYAKQADSSGMVAWTWKVGTRTTPGSWRIVVEASHDGKTASKQTYFTVR